MLQFRKCHVLRLFGVGHAEVHENALNVKVRQLCDLYQRGKRLLRLIGKEAQAGHAGVDFQMNRQLASRTFECLVEVLCILQSVDLLCDGHRCFIGRVLRGRIAENQNRKSHAAAAQLNCLFEVGDRQILRAQLFQRPADLHGAVTVGVRLHNAEESRSLSDMLAQCPIIMLQIVQRDISPCSFEYFHCLSLPFVN